MNKEKKNKVFIETDKDIEELTPPETPKWRKEFDEIYYYQKAKKYDGRYIFICQNSYLIEKILQLLQKEKKKDRAELLERIEKMKHRGNCVIGQEGCNRFNSALDQVLQLIKEQKL